MKIPMSKPAFQKECLRRATAMADKYNLQVAMGAEVPPTAFLHVVASDVLHERMEALERTLLGNKVLELIETDDLPPAPKVTSIRPGGAP